MAIRGEYWWVRWRPDGLDWAHCVGGESAPRQEGSCDEWDALPAPEGARLVLCVPPESVRVHTVRIPTRNRSRFRAALPFALEDQLLRDPEEYHFVPLPRPKGQADTPVAVVERSRMDAWLEGLTERSWRLRLLVPEFLAVAPPEPGSWLLDAAASPMLLRLPRGGGGAALSGEAAEQPPGGLILALEGAAEPPSTLRVRVRDRSQAETVARWQGQLEPRGVALDVLNDARSRAVWLARQPLPENRCNLLTGPYATGEDPRQWARRLIPAAAMAGVLLLVLAFQWFLEGSRIHNEHRRLEEAITATYREAFPGAKNIVDPRYQMEQRLNRLQAQQGDTGTAEGLMVQLGKVAPLFSEGSGEKRLQGVQYDGSSLTLEVSLADYEVLERLERRLAEKGEVEVENAELKEGRVHGRIRIREKG